MAARRWSCSRHHRHSPRSRLVPHTPWTWESDIGTTFTCSEEQLTNSSADWGELRMALNASIHSRLWSKAARHPDGDGLQGGMDLHSASLAYRSTRKRLGAPFASTAATVQCGGQWPRSRLHSCDTSLDPTCKRCRLEPETLPHRIWECPDNENVPETHASRKLTTRALEAVHHTPCLWLRGPPPPEKPSTIFHSPLPPPTSHDGLQTTHPPRYTAHSYTPS